jgi:hypothetical protein
LVAVLVTVTLAPGTAAPVLSITVPVIVPRSDCPKTNDAGSIASNTAQNNFKLALVIWVSSENLFVAPPSGGSLE